MIKIKHHDKFGWVLSLYKEVWGIPVQKFDEEIAYLNIHKIPYKIIKTTDDFVFINLKFIKKIAKSDINYFIDVLNLIIHMKNDFDDVRDYSEKACHDWNVGGKSGERWNIGDA